MWCFLQHRISNSRFVLSIAGAPSAQCRPTQALHSITNNVQFRNVSIPNLSFSNCVNKLDICTNSILTFEEQLFKCIQNQHCRKYFRLQARKSIILFLCCEIFKRTEYSQIQTSNKYSPVGFLLHSLFLFPIISDLQNHVDCNGYIWVNID